MNKKGFTLIELLIVIGIIVVLLGLAFPVFQGVQDRARKVQAKNDVTQIVTAVNAFYTEYGRYPTDQSTDATATYGAGFTSSKFVFDELRAKTATLNITDLKAVCLPKKAEPSLATPICMAATMADRQNMCAFPMPIMVPE